MDKATTFARLATELEALLYGTTDPVAAMANTAALIHEALDYASWTGFYRVVANGLLRVGPFQGPPACVEIPFTRGVCGAAARTGRTQVVTDVQRFDGHIACDARARSEIVVPVLAEDGSAVAVLDVDSHELQSFDEEDRAGLERLVEILTPHLSSPRA